MGRDQASARNPTDCYAAINCPSGKTHTVCEAKDPNPRTRNRSRKPLLTLAKLDAGYIADAYTLRWSRVSHESFQ